MMMICCPEYREAEDARSLLLVAILVAVSSSQSDLTVAMRHPEDLPAVVLRSLETTIARVHQTRPFHGVLRQEGVAEAVDHSEEEDSHVVHVAAAEAAGGKRSLLPGEK
jgi:hypothetical protein